MSTQFVGRLGRGCDRGHGILSRKSEEGTLYFVRGLQKLTRCFLSAVRFALTLHQHHEMPLSRAYATSVAQFRALRSEQEVANMIATLEAEAYGAEFGPTETERGFSKELEALKTWNVDERYDQNAIAARKRWKAVVEREQPAVPWTAGQEYVRLWREGIRPSYSPALTEPVSITAAGLSSSATADPDFMQVLQKS